MALSDGLLVDHQTLACQLAKRQKISAHGLGKASCLQVGAPDLNQADSSPHKPYAHDLTTVFKLEGDIYLLF